MDTAPIKHEKLQKFVGTVSRTSAPRCAARSATSAIGWAFALSHRARRDAGRVPARDVRGHRARHHALVKEPAHPELDSGDVRSAYRQAGTRFERVF
jgi:hypothetical protein